MELESRFTESRKDCPHPERWHSPDSDSTEIEVSRLVAAFVEALRPDLVIETGSAFGPTAELIGQVLFTAGVGPLVNLPVHPARGGTPSVRGAGLPVPVAPPGVGRGARSGSRVQNVVIPAVAVAFIKKKRNSNRQE